MGCRKDSLPDGSELDADDETIDTDAARLGDLDASRRGRDPRARGARWMQDRADPHAHERAFDIARHDPPGVSSAAAVAEVRDVLDSIGDTCPKCPTLGA
jgi:hypothetical protein